MTNDEIRERLFSLADEDYKVFHSKLMPTVDSERIIGVRTPMLRTFAKELHKSAEYSDFINDLPHKYYEEDNLHGFLIEKIKDFDECLNELERLLPFIDNWATCDMLRPKCLKNEPEKLYDKICQWLTSNKVYTVRFAIGCLLSYYLDGHFSEEHLKLVSKIRSEEYYINMMIAWYFATALSKQYDSTIGYITERRLSPWVHKKTIQKAVESYRISDEVKAYLKSLR
ncbi:MAG: DNA alkylation repair protein [Clostridia bacterium]|nr:DNA alkylation repair protein [Clostridia bacterium]